MPLMSKHEPGMFCWADLSTTDAGGALRFYSELMGWTSKDVPTSAGGIYTMLYKDGESVAALYQQPPEQKGMPPMWTNYVAVTSVDETVEKAVSLGAKIVLPPGDVDDDWGRLAFFQDPGEATIAIWQAGRHIGAGRYGDPGSLCWAELLTRDSAEVERFYTALFGWTIERIQMPGDGGVYTMFNSQGSPGGCMMDMPSEMTGIPPFWTAYFAVSHTAATLERARELGGRESSEGACSSGRTRFRTWAS